MQKTLKHKHMVLGEGRERKIETGRDNTNTVNQVHTDLLGIDGFEVGVCGVELGIQLLTISTYSRIRKYVCWNKHVKVTLQGK